MLARFRCSNEDIKKAILKLDENILTAEGVEVPTRNHQCVLVVSCLWSCVVSLVVSCL